MSGHRFGGPKPALPDDTRVLELQWAQAHVGTSLSVSRPTIVRVQLQKELQEFSQAAQTTVLPDATPRKVFRSFSLWCQGKNRPPSQVEVGLSA